MEAVGSLDEKKWIERKPKLECIFQEEKGIRLNQ
jgi:hypothetical protein